MRDVMRIDRHCFQGVVEFRAAIAAYAVRVFEDREHAAEIAVMTTEEKVQ